MEPWTIVFIVLFLAALLTIYLIVYFKDKKSAGREITTKTEDAKGTLQLKLQAYERLILLADRIALPNLISRMNLSGVGCKEMQSLLIQTIKQEFDHNITQQLYVSPEAWEAIRNLKEQNMLIINQVGSFLPETASGTDLNKALMELLVQNPQASLHNIVAEALSYEVKKVLG